MRYFIGIDVAKFKHTACVIDTDGTVLVESFDFTNDIIGFQSLLKNIKPFLKKKHLVGMEDTGHYGDNLRNFLLEKQYTVVMLNPIVTSHIRKASNKAKNDRIDCFVIANTMMNPNFYRDQQAQSIDYATVRQLTRMHHTHMEEINRYKCQLQKSIDIVFPEFNSLLNTKYSKTYLEILDTYHSAYTIANTDIRLLRNTLKNVGVGRSVSISAEQLKKAAKESIGQHNLAIEMDIPFLISLIRRLTSILGEIDKKIEEFSHQLNSPILDISGISHFSAMSIISELGDITYFSNEKKLIKFAGVNPYVYESGTYSMTHTRLEKKGSKYLRKTLYQIIDVVIRFNPVFQAFYQKKISQGKSYRCAQGHCIRKLLRVIYKILSTGERFNPVKLK
jgi:hypothetical protein